MSGVRFSFPASIIAGKGQIDRHDLMLLRKFAFADGITTYDSALQLLALNDICQDHCPEWPDYFVEQLTLFIVHRAPPCGYIDQTKAAWLIRALGQNGIVGNALQLEFILNAMWHAESCPNMLRAFALQQLRHPLSGGTGGGYHRHPDAPSGMANEDIAYLWRIIGPLVSDGRLQLSTLETSILHGIEDLVSDRDNHSSWQEIMDGVRRHDDARSSLRSKPWLTGIDLTDLCGPDTPDAPSDELAAERQIATACHEGHPASGSAANLH